MALTYELDLDLSPHLLNVPVNHCVKSKVISCSIVIVQNAHRLTQQVDCGIWTTFKEL